MGDLLVGHVLSPKLTSHMTSQSHVQVSNCINFIVMSSSGMHFTGKTLEPLIANTFFPDKAV